MLLTGTFRRSIDEKLRLAIPKRLREAMWDSRGGEEEEEEDRTLSVFIAPGTDGSLEIYTEVTFERLAARLAQASPTEQHVRAFTRLFFARAQRAELDRQGRVRISTELAEAAQLAKGADVVLLGVQDHLELWGQERWEVYLAEKRSHYDDLAEAAFGGRGAP